VGGVYACKVVGTVSVGFFWEGRGGGSGGEGRGEERRGEGRVWGEAFGKRIVNMGGGGFSCRMM